ncbi:sugar ABC transporter permease [Fodinisporobacter ferrooxydans]|uniref:Sugar ABC transporter permease n=1 Tax=Fodinisporobacter ferrooxydans TaxID=2901836 RepID=A0ABY4CDX9_9BACL|nr:sugar ABC transporter permease [Alicyclobacillaceae bacterium MYW30-H2]
MQKQQTNQELATPVAARYARTSASVQSQRRNQWLALMLLSPALILFIMFGIGPMLGAAYLSVLKWNGLGSPVFVGLSNWIAYFHDTEALKSLWLTIEVMIFSWLIQTPISMMVGLYLAGRQRHRSWIGTGYFLPLLLSSVAIGLLWSYILNPNFGLVDTLMTNLHLKFLALDWLGSPRLALWSLVAIVSWQYIPFHSLLYQAGRRQVSESLYEAACLDGANGWQEFWFITLPQLKYTVVTSTVLMLTGSLTYFDLIYILTNGGPGDATNVLALNMYETAFNKQLMGYGSVMAVVIAVFGILLSVVMIRLTGFKNMESQAEGV